MIPRVGVASSIAEGFLVLPFARRDEQHTGHHPSVPPTLLATGLLQHDGSAPDVSALQEADFGDGDDRDRRLPEQMRVRLSKLKTLQDNGIDAYPVGQPPSHTVAQALGIDDQTTVSVSGRVLRIRDFGGVLFAQLRDWSAEVQLLLDNSILEQGRAADFTKAIDLGDLIEVTGRMGFSKTGTRSLIVRSWRLIGKCLRPLPEQVERPDRPRSAGAQPLRRPGGQRRVARADHRPAAACVRAIRDTLTAKGFLEVETPILQQVHGGATARPFITHINSLRPRPVSADRARALPQAALRRWRGAGVRAGPGLPQRGRRLQSQPGIHAAGGVSGARRLQRPGSTAAAS